MWECQTVHEVSHFYDQHWIRRLSGFSSCRHYPMADRMNLSKYQCLWDIVLIHYITHSWLWPRGHLEVTKSHSKMSMKKFIASERITLSCNALSCNTLSCNTIVLQCKTCIICRYDNSIVYVIMIRADIMPSSTYW